MEHENDLAETFRNVLREVLADQEEHRTHHDWVQAQIDREHARAEFWQGLAAKALPGIIWTLFAGACAGIWKLISNHWHW